MARKSSKTNNLHHRGRKAGPTSTEKVPVAVTPVQRTEALLRGMSLVLEHINAPTHIVEALSVQVHSYLDNSLSEGVWLKRCKHLLSYPLAKYLKNEPPPAPDVIFKPSGKLRSWMKPRLNAFNSENTYLWYSWFQAKRCTLPLSVDLINEAYEKHFCTLSSSDPASSEILDEIFDDPTFLHVLEKVQWAVMDRMEGTLFPEWTAKTSASWELTRKSGGQQAALRGLAGLQSYAPVMDYKGKMAKYKYDDTNTVIENPYDQMIVDVLGRAHMTRIRTNTVVSDDFHSMEYRPWVYTTAGPKANYHLEKRCAYGREEWSTLRKVATDQYFYDRPLDCTIQAVLEPNKIRIISKGEALPYYNCKPLQKAMQSVMKEISCFRPIGRPILTSDIELLTRNAGQFDKWFSVDYSAATDGLSISYSKRIFDKIIGLFPEFEQKRFRQVLGEHNLYYPRDKGKREHKGMQANGQLMGSILSFPILCLANLGVYLLATRETQLHWDINERINHVLINGDDMVYASQEEVWLKHVDIGKKVGLEMSVGKAYVHREYLNINSTSYHCPLHHRDQLIKGRIVREIGYLNAGLFFGLHKVQGKQEEGKVETADSHHGDKPGIVANIDCLLRGSRPGKQKDLLKKLLVAQKETIAEECRTKDRNGKSFSRNLFIPISLGGMGIKPPPQWRFKITKEELYVAHGYINEYPGCPYTSQHPLPGYPLGDRLEDTVSVPWEPKLEGQLALKPLVPVKRINLKWIKHFCRTDFIRYVPFKGCSTASLKKNERNRAPPYIAVQPSAGRDAKVVPQHPDIQSLNHSTNSKDTFVPLPEMGICFSDDINYRFSPSTVLLPQEVDSDVHIDLIDLEYQEYLRQPRFEEDYIPSPEYCS
jgi:hypothetical protein